MDNRASKRLSDIFNLVSLMVFRMVHLIVQLSPVAACALTAWVVGTQGIVVLEKLLKLIGCAYLAFGIQYLVFGLIIYGWTRLSPLPFFKKSVEYQTLAFSTSSTKAALPTTIKVCENRLGVSSLSSSFVLPLGASINMDGIAIYISLCVLFFAQATGKVLGIADYGSIILLGTLGSIGGAGIPGGTIVMLPMVLGAVGLPIEGIALIAGIDRIVDMMRTTISITGDATVALCVDHSEGLLDKNKYYANI
jgi:Na+/H+-dicarboxylate symporter